MRKFTLGQLYRIVVLASTASAVALAVFGCTFLYRYLYKAITETEYIVSFQREYAIDPLRFQSYRALVDGDEHRKTKTPPDWTNAPNPFAKY